MEGGVTDLSKYRFERAISDFNTAKILYELKEFKSSVNRSYYAIFHALRSVLALDGIDSKKHSGVIVLFNQYYVKTDNFDKSISTLISTSFWLREKADYEDFFIVTEQEALEQISKAETVIGMVEKYLASRQETE